MLGIDFPWQDLTEYNSNKNTTTNNDNKMVYQSFNVNITQL